MRATRSAAELLGVAAIDADGLLVREDGACVRYLEVGSVNPLVVDQAEGERISAAFAQIAARLPDRQALQLYVQGTHAGSGGRCSREESLPLRACSRCRGGTPDEHDRATGDPPARASPRSSRSERPRGAVKPRCACAIFVVCPVAINWTIRLAGASGAGRRALRESRTRCI